MQQLYHLQIWQENDHVYPRYTLGLLRGTNIIDASDAIVKTTVGTILYYDNGTCYPLYCLISNWSIYRVLSKTL